MEIHPTDLVAQDFVRGGCVGDEEGDEEDGDEAREGLDEHDLGQARPVVPRHVEDAEEAHAHVAADVPAEVAQRHEQREERGLAFLRADLGAEDEEGDGGELAEEGHERLDGMGWIV